MNIPICSLLACCLFALTGPVAHAGAPRDVAEQVATLIENNYFDSGKAQAIAGALRAAEIHGEFDAFTRPRDLATALTSVLHPLDPHLRVLWSSTTGSPLAHGAGADLLASPGLGDPRGAYGFRRVEMLPGAIGCIELTFFADLESRRRDDPARLAADAALQLTAGAAGLIVDLRDNIGGSLDMAGYLISAFVPHDATVYDVTHTRDGLQSDRPAVTYQSPRIDVPLYVLISARTASAAEAFAYTLQAAHRAIVVGETSAGAANSGGSFPLGDGLSVFVPVGTPVNPLTHTNWEGRGVQPDVRVDARQALASAQQLALIAVLARDPDGPTAGYVRLVLQALQAPASAPGPSLRDYRGDYNGVLISQEGDGLVLRQGNRIPLELARLNGDTFFDRSEPSRRIVFERSTRAQIRGLEMVYANGRVLWYPREPLRLPALDLYPH
jgi:hypothetical protein